jgi:AcrR family transcriptional regulator
MSDTRIATRSRENTRARLMDAAFEVFAEEGLDGASVEAICERAGFTRGAFYSNFESKDELFLALVSTVSEQKLQAVSARVDEITAGDQTPASPAEIVQRVVDVSIDTRQGVLLLSEIRIRAMRDSRMAAAYWAWQTGMTERVEAIINDLVRAYGFTLRMPSGDFARVILNSWETTSVNALIAGLDYDATCRLISERTERIASALIEGFPASR